MAYAIDYPRELERIAEICDRFAAPCIYFEADFESKPKLVGASRFGGSPDAPIDFVWPIRSAPEESVWPDRTSARHLDFLLQINFAEVSRHDSTGILPRSGLLSFFYDAEYQPWGYDPKNRDGSKVVYTREGIPLERFVMEGYDEFPEIALAFRPGLTLPIYDSRDFVRLERKAGMTEEEMNCYLDFSHQIRWNSTEKPPQFKNQLLGHSANIQGDMQLEAQLVTHGVYIGHSYPDDSILKELETGADDWILLLQLDTDDDLGVMWGDMGMLYYWIRKQDLESLNFDNVWVDLQCY